MMAQQIRVWGLTRREVVLWLGLLGCATGGGRLYPFDSLVAGLRQAVQARRLK